MCRWTSQHEHREDNHFLQKCHPQRASLQSKSSTVSQTDSGCQSTFSQPPSACSMGSCPNQPWSHCWRMNSNDFANHTTKNTLPSKALIQIQWRDQKFIDKQKLREFITTQTRFTTNAKRTFLGRKHKRRKRSTQNKPKTIKNVVIGSCISIITLNVNGLNAPTKRHWLTGWVKTCACMHFHL